MEAVVLSRSHPSTVIPYIDSKTSFRLSYGFMAGWLFPQVDFEDVYPSPRPHLYDTGDIYLASRTGNLARVKHLVEHRHVDINRRDFWDAVPLYYACLCGHRHVVKYLLDRGAVCNEHTFDGDRCLYGALTSEIAELLLHGDVNKVPPLKPLADALRKLCSLCDDPEQSVPISRSFERLCDVELTIEDHVYRLNRAMLAARLTRFDEVLSAQPTDDGIVRLSLSEKGCDRSVVEVLLAFVYCERVDVDMKHVDQLRRLATSYGHEALVKMIDREQQSIHHYFKATKEKPIPKRMVLYPRSFPEEASLERAMKALRSRSMQLDVLSRETNLRLDEIRVRNDYADALLNVEGMSIRVHLCILCARSDFFYRLVFSSDAGYRELPSTVCPLFGRSMSLIDLPEASVMATGHLLEFIYTHDVTGLSESDLIDLDVLSELFALSDRLLIFEAKRSISARIRQRDLDFCILCQLLRLADFYAVACLRDDCLERIATRLDDILSAVTSSEMVLDFEELVAECAPEDFADAESLFDSSATKGDFHGIIDGDRPTGVGRNTLLEDLREKYLEQYGVKGDERDRQAARFDEAFLRFARGAVGKRLSSTL